MPSWWMGQLCMLHHVACLPRLHVCHVAMFVQFNVDLMPELTTFGLQSCDCQCTMRLLMPVWCNGCGPFCHRRRHHGCHNEAGRFNTRPANKARLECMPKITYVTEGACMVRARQTSASACNHLCRLQSATDSASVGNRRYLHATAASASAGNHHRPLQAVIATCLDKGRKVAKTTRALSGKCCC